MRGSRDREKGARVRESSKSMDEEEREGRRQMIKIEVRG